MQPHGDLISSTVLDIPKAGNDGGNSRGEEGAGEAHRPFSSRDRSGRGRARSKNDEAGLREATGVQLIREEYSVAAVARVRRKKQSGAQRIAVIAKRVPSIVDDGISS